MSLSRAARALRNRTRRRPGIFSQRPYLSSNLSYVLHEHSASEAVHRVSQDVDAHADRLARITDAPPIVAVQGELSGAIDVWLVATLGAVPWYQMALQQATDLDVPLCCIDADVPDTQPAAFFRGAAMLALNIPDTSTVGVASVVLRPGGQGLQVIIDGPYVWPGERDQTLRALERLIQRDVDQWLPPRSLWSKPAEAALGDEIVRAGTR